MVDDAPALHAIYGVFARHLRMPSDQRRRILGRDRGLDPALRSRLAPLLALPPRGPGRSRALRPLIEDLRRTAPDEALARVPELWARRGGGYAVLEAFEEAKYLEPWADEDGRVVALRAYMGKRAAIRYKTCPGRRGPLLHFAFGVPREQVAAAPWVFTEGWMKAEVAAHALGATAVAFAGVNQKRAWRRAIEIKRRLAPDAPSYIAFDAEAWTTRPDITVHALELARSLRWAERRTAGFAVWDAEAGKRGVEPKGIDDAVAAGRDVQLVGRLSFAAHLEPALAAWRHRAAA